MNQLGATRTVGQLAYTAASRPATGLASLTGAASAPASACGWRTENASAIAATKQAFRLHFVDVPMHRTRRLRKPSP